MDDIVCEICIKDYNNDVIVPRVLSCGHTICTSCITQILQTSGCCPKCRKAMSCDNCNMYPINYSLLGMVDSLKNDANLQSFLQRRLKILKRKFVSLETKLTETKVSLENNLDVISTSLTSIQELIDDENIDVDTCNQTILTLNQQLEDLRGVSCLNFVKLKSSTTLNCCDFQQPMEFVREIYKQVANHEIFYAVTKVDEEAKFSRITVWGDKLVLHAFGPPIEDPKIKTVWEIKNCLRSDNVHALLEVNCNEEGIRQMIVVKTINSSLVPQFFKYCTGEMGPVYKGATFYQGTVTHIGSPYVTSVLTVDKCIVNGVEADGNFEYISTLGTSATYTTNDLVVIGKSNGSFQIVHLTTNVNIINVIGKIEEPLQLQQKITHGNNRKVTDSGLIINL